MLNNNFEYPLDYDEFLNIFYIQKSFRLSLKYFYPKLDHYDYFF